MYTNIEAAKQLIKKYRSMSVEELEESFEYYSFGEEVMKNITGFGSQSTCILCRHVDRDSRHETICSNCIWHSLFPVAEEYPCTEHETYEHIEYAEDAVELEQALVDRAKLLEKAIYKAEQENLKYEN